MNKTLQKFLFRLTLLLLVLLPLTSCEDEESVITYSLVCSEDVLEYLQPTVKYLDGNGNQVEKTLNKDDFQVVEENNDGIPSGITAYNVVITYDHFGVENRMVVTFSTVKPLAGEKTTYEYAATLVVSAKAQNGTTQNNQTDIETGAIASLPMIEQRFQYALDKLLADGLHKNTTINSKGKIEIN